jgi:hypothetical protein
MSMDNPNKLFKTHYITIVLWHRHNNVWRNCPFQIFIKPEIKLYHKCAALCEDRFHVLIVNQTDIYRRKVNQYVSADKGVILNTFHRQTCHSKTRSSGKFKFEFISIKHLQYMLIAITNSRWLIGNNSRSRHFASKTHAHTYCTQSTNLTELSSFQETYIQI